MKRLHIFLPEVFVERLKLLARKTGLTWTFHLRQAILEYLERKEREKP